MPTYGAVGITAKLSVANLADTLSSSIHLKQGPEAKETMKRIKNVFEAGRDIPERPIGADGNEKGVLQFIGDQEDIPFFMVEAGENIRSPESTAATSNTIAWEGKQPSTASAAAYPATSNLNELLGTSLEASPSSGAIPKRVLQASVVESTNAIPEEPLMQAPATVALPIFQPRHDSTRGETNVDQPLSDALALMLTVETSLKSHLVEEFKKRGEPAIPELKIEVFLNGDLVDVAFINPRRPSATIGTGNKVQFFGTRIHRQVEKPWVYQTSNSITAEKKDTGQRWKAISASLQEEAIARGVDKYGFPPLSSQYLHALSKISMPDRIKKITSFGTIDVVIVTGRGRKYGPDSFYLCTPTRMYDRERSVGQLRLADDQKTTNAIPTPLTTLNEEEDTKAEFPFSTPLHTSLDAFADSEPSAAPQDASTDAPPIQPPDAALYEPLFSQNDSAHDDIHPPITPKRKKREYTKARDYAAGIGFDLKDLKTPVGQFSDHKGKTRMGRSLAQRLADVRQMSSRKRERELSKLWQHLYQNPALIPPDRKPRSLEQNVTAKGVRFPTAPNQPVGNTAPVYEGGQVTARDLLMSTEPTATLAQARMDMAIQYGAPIEGYLAKLIASTSPHNTPIKKRLLAPAMPPASTEEIEDRGEKTPKSSVPPPSTLSRPQRRSSRVAALDSSPSFMLSSPEKDNLAVQTPQRAGASKTADSRTPTAQQTTNEAVSSFEIPELCKGSVVSYAGGGAQRQISKARPGEFTEAEIVVGMRFVVV